MENKKEHLLEVNKLSKLFEIRKGLLSRPTGYVHAVEDVSFFIDPGKILGVVGESGCGKTTVGKMVMGLLEPTEGTIKVEGENFSSYINNTRKMKPIRRKIQIVFQDPHGSLNPRMTAGRLVGEPLLVHKLGTEKEIREKVRKIFNDVGLRKEHMARYAHEFSGGQRQRLAIARALSLNPKLIVADEAVSALDVSIQASIINLLLDLRDQYELSYLFIAHDIAVVEHVSDYVAVMYLGKLVEMARREDLFKNPRHPYTRALLSGVPVPDPKLRNRERIVLTGDIPSPANPPKGCRFHTRCPLAEPRCKSEEPMLKTIEDEHHVSCLLVQ